MKNLETQIVTQMKSILLVDDDRLIIATLSNGLARAGYRVTSAESVDEAEKWLNNNDQPDLVILDVRMPDRDGLELIEYLNDSNQIPFILLTAHSDQEIITQAKESGAMGYLVKPVDISQLIPTIETAIYRSQEIKNLRKAKQQLQTALDADRAISVATGIIMDQHLINHDDALELLRRTARSEHLKLIELASSIINSRETLNLRNSV
ncbi:MAG: response regulator [Methylophilus sp.]|nr:response regulator [Methylophilus sp.]